MMYEWSPVIHESTGKDVYHRSFDTLLERNKRAVANLIKTEIPSEGTRFEDYIDGALSLLSVKLIQELAGHQMTARTMVHGKVRRALTESPKSLTTLGHDLVSCRSRF
jgi:hypothetical protein